MPSSNRRSNADDARDPALFSVEAPRIPAGRVRRGLDADVRKAAAAGVELAGAPLAACRSLADQIDQLERLLRNPAASPYDRVPLAGLAREFREAYDACFAAVQRAGDPFAIALERFLEHDAGAGDPATRDPA